MSFSISNDRGHLQVVPSDAVPGITEGRLDPLLFDITELLEIGYDDSHRKGIPVILTYEQSSAFAAAAPPPPSRLRRRLASIDGIAVECDKNDGARFWSEVTVNQPGAAGRSFTLRNGVKKLWLDGRLRPTLDESVPMVGAPIAWSAGYRGAGIKVAVLDTGVDATHPDLATRVIAAKNFSSDADQRDHIGHGTHVASTVAGTGAASDGRYTGVAPEAQIIDGKVCGGTITNIGCEVSAIVAGMEWAADQGAKVVNMSLGKSRPDGIPIDDAVERLTTQKGVLFVVSAGNTGTVGTIDAPGTSPFALTVGAVTKQDEVWTSSSRGPAYDGSIKPDLTAPGVDITAARSSSAGGSPTERYWSMDGTSMASPHVAGAAALLLQKHPTWTPATIKGTLMGSAIRREGYTPYEQGAGRLNIGAAMDQTVISDPPSLALGFQQWPHSDDPPITRTVTYRNEGDVAITYTLAFSTTAPGGGSAPAGMFTVDTPSITVPAHGSVQVVATIDTRVVGPDGFYSGELVATTATGSVVRTPLVLEKEIESYDVVLRHMNRNGELTSSYSDYVVGPLADGVKPRRWEKRDPSGIVTLRLPRGRYHVGSSILPRGPDPSLLVQPALDVTSAQTVDLDARLAKPIEITVPKASARAAMTFVSYSVKGLEYQAIRSGLGEAAYTAQLGPSVPGFLTEYGAFLAEPGEDGFFANSPYVYNVAWHERDHFITGAVHHLNDSQFARVDARYAAQTETQRYGSKRDRSRPADAADWRRPEYDETLWFPTPFNRTEYYLAGDRLWKSYFDESNEIFNADYDTSLASEVLTFPTNATTKARWAVGPFAPSMPVREAGRVPSAVRQGDRLSFVIPMYGDQAGRDASARTDEGTRTALYRGTELVAEDFTPGVLFTDVPGALSTYKLVVDARRSIGSDYSTQSSSAWTFQSQTESTERPLPLLAPRFTPNLDDRNKAPYGGFVLPLAIDRNRGSTTSPVGKPAVDVSYDDGATWKPATVAPVNGGTWTVILNHPMGGSFVSLRVRVQDRAGNAVDQTIVRAYGLR